MPGQRATPRPPRSALAKNARGGHRRPRITFFLLYIAEKAQTDLPKIALATGAVRGRFGFRQRGKEQAGQNRDDGDNDKEFYQSKRLERAFLAHTGILVADDLPNARSKSWSARQREREPTYALRGPRRCDFLRMDANGVKREIETCPAALIMPINECEASGQSVHIN